ncbi:hypothetical protein [Sinomonas sp. G460-2]|uniref:hypothetical protein n=1 Tax=Sinomonas sp. G460-2 TaxID=3393464 RepID=UPI0039F116B6
MRPVDHDRRARIAAELEERFPAHAGRLLAVLDVNPSAAMPYHGTPHLLVVAHAVLELADGEHLATEDTDLVLLAALFHDYDHAGATDDPVNIARAVAAVRAHCAFHDADRIAELVEATCFPHHGPADDPAVAVLRDADIVWSSLLVPDAQRFRNGLAKERGTPATEQDAIAFVIGHGLNTATAARAIDRHFRQPNCT